MSKCRFLGWDCANKSLAWSLMKIDLGIRSKLLAHYTQIIALFDKYCGAEGGNKYIAGEIDAPSDPEFRAELSEWLSNITETINGFVEFLEVGVADILHGKKVAEVDDVSRTRALHQFMTARPTLCDPAPDTTVIVERQPNRIGLKTNNKSTAVANQLTYHYISRDHDCVLIDPSLKNKIALRADLTLAHLISAGKNAKFTSGTRYTARKKHTKVNFLYLVEVFNLQHLLVGIPKSCLDDVADAVMEVFAYLLENKLYC